LLLKAKKAGAHSLTRRDSPKIVFVATPVNSSITPLFGYFEVFLFWQNTTESVLYTICAEFTLIALIYARCAASTFCATFAISKIQTAMASTQDIKTGLILKLDGSLYSVVDFGQNKTARSAAKVWAKLKGVDNTRSIEHTWNSGETIYPVRVERHAYQFLYKDDMGYNFMNNETYEQVVIQENLIEGAQFYKDGQEVMLVVNTESDTIMGAELPSHIVCAITYTEPGMKGDTATRTLKAATIDTGATVMVPLFCDEGELIKVDTRTGAYVERVKAS
jgi:elongation factor P